MGTNSSTSHGDSGRRWRPRVPNPNDQDSGVHAGQTTITSSTNSIAPLFILDNPNIPISEQHDVSSGFQTPGVVLYSPADGPRNSNDEPDDPMRSDDDSSSKDSQHSKHVKVVVYVVVVATLVMAGVFGVAFVKSRIPSIPQLPQMCLSPACIRASSQIVSNLASGNVDPCRDFHQHVCGNYEGGSSSSTFLDMAHRRDYVMRRILEGQSSSHELEISDAGLFSKIGNFYSSCMNLDAIKSVGLAPVKDVVREITEMFPAGGSISHTDQKQTSDVIFFLAEMGISALLSFNTVADQRDPKKLMLELAPPSFGLELKHYFANDFTTSSALEDYELSIALAFRKFDFPKHLPGNASHSKWRKGSRSQLSKSGVDWSKLLAKAVVRFEKDLAKVLDGEDVFDPSRHSSLQHKPFPDPGWNPLPVDQVDKLVPLLGIKKILAKLNPTGDIPKTINIRSPEYIVSLANVLLTSPPLSTQAYFSWRSISSLQGLVDQEMQALAMDAIPRWQTCVRSASSLLGPILGHFYVKQEASNNTKTASEDIINSVKHALLQFSTSRTDGKLSGIDIRAGYPSKLLDVSYLQKKYNSLTISPKQFFHNTITALRHNTHHKFSSVSIPTSNWSPLDVSPAVVVPEYDVNANTLTIPAALLQAPIFDSDLPSYMNFGGIGSLVGSILGRLTESTPTIAASLKLEMRGATEQAKLDALGLQAAFSGWKKINEGKTDEMLSGLQDYSQDQTMFLSYGQMWCGDGRGLGFDGIHTNLKDRLNVAVGKSKSFLSVWECQKG